MLKLFFISVRRRQSQTSFFFTDWGTDRLQKNDKQTQDTMWQDNWDDEEIDDDFCKQLRAQLQNK